MTNEEKKVTEFGVNKKTDKIFELKSEKAVVLHISKYEVTDEFFGKLSGDARDRFKPYVGKEVNSFQINVGKKDIYKIGPVPLNTIPWGLYDTGKLTINFEVDKN